MRSAPLRRKKPLRSRSRLRQDPAKTRAWQRRSKPLPAVNRKRARWKYERNYGRRGALVRSHPCCVPGCRCQEIQAAHVVARGMGGCGGDRRSLVPLCWRHHAEQGQLGVRAFERLYRICLVRIALHFAQLGDQLGLP